MRSLYHTFFISLCCGLPIRPPHLDEDLSWVLNVPLQPWYNAGILADYEMGRTPILNKAAVKKKNRSDGEATDAIDNYFWGKSGGIVLEMGAINGNWTSESLPFVSIGWHRILIEGSPVWRADLLQWRESFTYNAAVCESERLVHYAMNRNFFVSGIIEFMTEQFLSKWYKRVYALAKGPNDTFNITNIDWRDLKKVHEIKCLPLAKILSHAQVNVVNFMILDVEGAEIVALKSVDFSKVRFDVIAVECNREFELLKFFENTNYRFDKKQGRNLWFVHREFVPSVRPRQN